MSRLKKGASEFAARRSKAVLILYFALRLIVGGLLIYHIFRGNYESAFTCALALVLFVLPALLERRLHIDLPNTLEIIILLFIFAAEILGELQSYYITYPYWDTMLHTTSGFLTAAIGFSMIDILNRNSRTKFHLSPIYCAVAAFCFSMTVGVLWEFWEFTMDRLFLMDMQKDTIIPHHAERGHAGQGHPRCDRQRPVPGAGRISGHRPLRHHGGSVRQLRRRCGLLGDRLFLYQTPRPRQGGPSVYSRPGGGSRTAATLKQKAGLSPPYSLAALLRQIAAGRFTISRGARCCLRSPRLARRYPAGLGGPQPFPPGGPKAR